MSSISGKTTLLGLIGHPVSHSFSPRMHNAAAADLGLDYAYLPLPVAPENLEAALKGLPALGFRGINITIPHKQAVMPFLDHIDEAALAIGAVNTIVFEPDGSSHGFNTDWSGFTEDLNSLGVGVFGRNALIFGAGGSARAIVYALLKVNAKIHLLARRPEQAQQLVAAMSSQIDTSKIKILTPDQLDTLDVPAPLIINTTPVGMSPNTDRSIWPQDLPMPDNAVVYDLVYNPKQTRLMQQAEAVDLHAANGLGMLLWQGAHAFKLWTDVEPDLKVMEKALENL